MGIELHCISPMLFCFYNHRLNNSAVLYMVTAGKCVSLGDTSLLLCCISGALLCFSVCFLHPGEGRTAGIQPKPELLRENTFVFFPAFLGLRLAWWQPDWHFRVGKVCRADTQTHLYTDKQNCISDVMSQIYLFIYIFLWFADR